MYPPITELISEPPTRALAESPKTDPRLLGGVARDSIV